MRRCRRGIADLDRHCRRVESRGVGIAVLGPLTIEGEQKVLGRRDRVVLAALVVHPGEVVSAEQLADVLWGEQLPPSWSKVVQGCVVRLASCSALARSRPHSSGTGSPCRSTRSTPSVSSAPSYELA